MKKKIVALLMLACVMGFTGCDSDTDDTEEKVRVEESKETESKEESKAAESTEESKVEETKVEETKVEETKVEETKVEETKVEETKVEAPDTAFINPDAPTVTVGGDVEFVKDGYHMVVPNEYFVMYDDSMGPIVYLPDTFQMKFAYRDSSFESVLEDIDAADDKAINAGADSVTEPVIYEYNGKQYLFFAVDLDGDRVIAIQSESVDGVGHMGGQIVLEDTEVRDMELVKMYATIMESAEATKEADSTREYVEAQTSTVSGVKMDANSITFEGKTYSYNVPQGTLYSDESGMEGINTNQYYESAKSDIAVSLEKSNFDTDDAEYFANLRVQYDDGKLTKYEVDGRTVYFVEVADEYNGAIYYYGYATCNLDDGYIFSVEASNRDKGMPTFDEIKTFFEIGD